MLRQNVIDLLHFSRKIPSIPVQRRMNLGPVVAARQLSQPRPSWTALFIKAYGRVCIEFPELRRAYLTFPFARIYEHPESAALVAVEREYEGSKALLFFQIRAPECESIARIDTRMKDARVMPLSAFHSFRMMRRTRWLPGFLRRFIWYMSLNLFGTRRVREFGTFGVSVYSSLGADSLHPISPLTTLLNYGPIAQDGSVDVRLIYDHRVMDGATIARALARLEAVLLTEIVDELKLLQQQQSCPARVA